MIMFSANRTSFCLPLSVHCAKGYSPEIRVHTSKLRDVVSILVEIKDKNFEVYVYTILHVATECNGRVGSLKQVYKHTHRSIEIAQETFWLKGTNNGSPIKLFTAVYSHPDRILTC